MDARFEWLSLDIESVNITRQPFLLGRLVVPWDFELYPGQSVLLITQGGTEKQHEDFLEILKETWLRVPCSDRDLIYNYYLNSYRCNPLIRFGAPVRYPAPLAQAGPKPFLFSVDALHIFDLPNRSWIMLVIAEELAHAYLIATQDPTHISDPPNDKRDSPECQAWDQEREDAMQRVLFRWPFDSAEYAELIAWLKSHAVCTPPK